METVIDLLQHVLKPLAEERNLTTWDAVFAYSEAEYFPSRIAFGKFKGRDFRDAADDSELREWLSWLSSSSNERSSRMGAWYLGQLGLDTKGAGAKPEAVGSASSKTDKAATATGTVVTAYQSIEAEELLLVKSDRSFEDGALLATSRSY